MKKKEVKKQLCPPKKIIHKHKTSYPFAEKKITEKVPIAFLEDKIGNIEKKLFKDIKKFETINYIYIVNKSCKLKGVISIKELFRQAKNKQVKEVMNKKIIVARPHTSLEKASYLAVKYNIKAIPIVDKNNVFLGILPNDEILYTTYKEISEDIFRLAGVHRPKMIVDNVLELSIWKSFKHRFPWLFVGLIGGIVAAKIIGLFEHTLKQNIILAAFLPLMVYMSGVVVTQMQAFIIRDLAINSKFSFLKYFFKQFGIVFLMGVFSSIVLCAISFVLYQNLSIGFMLGLALLAAISSSVVIGLVFPYVLSKMKFDPANASGPIAAIIQDILSIIVYFSIASWLI